MECGDLSPLLTALTNQRTPKKEKAAESLAVKLLPPSDFVRPHASPGSLYIAVTFGSGSGSSIDAYFF